MQEDIEHRTVTLIISGSKFTMRKLVQAAGKLLVYMKNRSHRDVTRHGRQSVKQLLRKDQGATIIEVNDPNLKDFQRIARRHGVDYAVRQVKGDQPKFLVFFKARDSDAITAMLTKALRKLSEFIPDFASYEHNRRNIYREAQKEAEEIFDRWADCVDGDDDEDYEPDEYFSD